MMSLGNEYNHMWFKYDAKNGIFTLHAIEDWIAENFATHLANGRKFKIVGKKESVSFIFYSSDIVYTTNVTPSQIEGHSIIYESSPFRSYRFHCKVREVTNGKFEFIK